MMLINLHRLLTGATCSITSRHCFLTIIYIYDKNETFGGCSMLCPRIFRL